jgi:hypothetical protein
MDDVSEQFLTRFAAGAGSQYRWTLTCERHNGEDEYSVRAFLTTPGGILQELCPISAQATYESGRIYQVNEWWAAACSQGMEQRWTLNPLLQAADGKASMDSDIRTRLLRICGLHEHPGKG